MRGVRFTAAEAALVRAGLEAYPVSDKTPKLRKAIASALAKLDEASQERRAPVTVGLSVQGAVSVLERVLGVGNVALPPHPDAAWFGRVGAVIKRQQYTAEDFARAGEALRGKGWSPPFSFERTVYAMDRLLAENTGSPRGIRGAPLSMGDL